MNKHLEFLNKEIDKYVIQANPGEFLHGNSEAKILAEFTPKTLSTQIVGKIYAKKQV